MSDDVKKETITNLDYVFFICKVKDILDDIESYNAPVDVLIDIEVCLKILETRLRLNELTFEDNDFLLMREHKLTRDELSEFVTRNIQ